MSDVQWEDQAQPEITGGEFYKFVKVGDTFIGHLINKRTRDGTYGKEFLFDFRTPDGTERTISAKSHLRPQLEPLNKGAYVRIVFSGERDVGKESPMHEFKVALAKVAPPIPPLKKASGTVAPF